MKKLVFIVAVAFSAALVSCGGNAAKTDDAVVTETVEVVEEATPCDSANCCNDSAACCNDSAACCAADTTVVANN